MIFDKISDATDRFVGYAAFGMLGAMVVIILVQVFSRYILQHSLSWSEEVGRYLFVWITFLGASMAMKRGVHVGVEFLRNRVPPPTKKWLILATQFMILAFLFVLTVEGIKIVGVVKYQTSPAVRLPMSYVYVSIPVSSILMIIHMIPSIIGSISALRREEGRREWNR